MLDAVLSSSNQHTSGHAKAAIAGLLDEPHETAPVLVRGGSGYGNEDIIGVCEQRGLCYLLRLRTTVDVKRLVERLFRRKDWTHATAASQSWQAIEDELRLSARSKARLTPMHAEAALIKSMTANVNAAIQHVKAAAEQLPRLDRWRVLLACIGQRIVG